MADKFPKATLGQYKGLAVTRHVRPVLDSTVEAEIGHRCRLHAHYSPTGAPRQAGGQGHPGPLRVFWRASPSLTAR